MRHKLSVPAIQSLLNTLGLYCSVCRLQSPTFLMQA